MKLQVSSLIPSGEVSRQLDNTAYENILKLLANLGDITAVAAVADQLGDITGNPAYTVSNVFPTSGMSIGDLVVNLLDGGIYEWKIVSPATEPAWVLIAQSAGTSSGTADAVIPIVDALPVSTTAGGMVFNTPDGLFYAYINGAWQTVVSPPAESATIGIAVYAVNPTTDLYEGLVIFNSTLNQLLKYTGGVWVQVVEPTGAAASVADGSLTTAKFAAGLRIVEVVDVLPAVDNSVGRLAMLTTDGQLYRYTATGWSTAVPTTALTGTITSTQIGANQVTTGALAVGAVTADTIATNAITSDKITANSITTAMIQVGAIGASQIATNAITAGKIAAGAVTTNALAALSVDATKIVAGTISADKMAANSITAGSITAGAVSTSHLAAGSVTATQLAAGSVTATKISTGTITLDKLQSSSVVTSSGVTFGIGIGSNIAGYPAGGYFSASSPSVFGLLASNSNGVAFATGNMGAYSSGQFFNSTSTTYSTHNTFAALASNQNGGHFQNNNSGKVIYLATPSYAFQTGGGATGSFTGAHDSVMLNTDDKPVEGDILVDVRVYAKKDIDDTMNVTTLSTTAKCKAVAGVYSGDAGEGHVPTSMSVLVKQKDGSSKLILDNKYTDISEYTMVVVNAIGEGQVNVCGMNGNIEVGDLITTSSIKGKGMKQDDDTLHSYTVGKARESVVFDTPEQVKMIACIYHCG